MAMSSALRSLRHTEPSVFWLDSPQAPTAGPALIGTEICDLAIVGGGFTGLWTALLAKEADPERDVIVVESGPVGAAASGRNGGFCVASLTHGLTNGLARFEPEMVRLAELGANNLEQIQQTLNRYGIDCDWEQTGELSVATEPWQAAGWAEEPEVAARYGITLDYLNRDQVQAEIHSPRYVAGLWDRSGAAILNPAKLAWGLAEACRKLGVRIYEHTPVSRLRSSRHSVTLTVPYGAVTARRVAIGTSAYPSLLRRARPYTVPVWDYVLMTEPLTAEQRESIGWRGRAGVGDSANQFHYYRLTADNRILWGGYDAIYHYGGRTDSGVEHRPATYATLAQHFVETFPQLEKISFTHRWGGAIDTCSRFCVFWGTAKSGRVAYASGYTGLGVGATRFGARVMLDLLSGEQTEVTSLRFVQSKPIPFPPEPLRYGAIQLTRWSIAHADQREGHRNIWLRALDRMGLGFDS
jgi:glycine/D-amino acid oxidase-like deaminating enzyme